MSLRSSFAAFFKSAVSPGGDVPYTYGPWSMYGGRGGWPLLLPSTRIDYRAEAGDLTQNSIVEACIGWIGRTFPEAPARVMRKTGTRQSEAIDDHPLTQLLETPNPYYNGLLLWQATLLSLNVNGNGYWLKVRNGGDKVIELWYEPHTTIRPYWPDDGSAFISGYEVQRRGEWKKLPRRDVVHFRDRIDPNNPRLGLSRLASAFREVFTDNEAANFSASLLRNMGIPGVVVSPATAEATIADPEGLKQSMVAKFSGDRRGEPLVMQGPTKVDVLSFSPEQLSLEALRNIPEERITALLGIPAVVAGLGAGLDKATYSNMEEARRAAYHNNLLPTQRLLAAQLGTDLVPEFGDNTREFVAFDTSQVTALAEDTNAKYKRLTEGYKGGWLKRSEARTEAGMPATPDDDLYITDIIALQGKLMETEPAGTLAGKADEKDDTTDA